jgi:hypothetical protein
MRRQDQDSPTAFRRVRRPSLRHEPGENKTGAQRQDDSEAVLGIRLCNREHERLGGLSIWRLRPSKRRDREWEFVP